MITASYLEDQASLYKDEGIVPILKIRMFEYPDKEFIYNENTEMEVLSGFPDLGCTNEVGFYYELKSAIDALNTNMCDIREQVYNAAFIQLEIPGLYTQSSLRMYFVWDAEKEGFFQAEEPKIFKSFIF